MSTYTDIAKEFCELAGMGHNGSESAWRMMQLSRLDRIADALEAIDSTLEDIDFTLASMEQNVGRCTTVNPNGSCSVMVSVTGNITTN